MFSPKIGEMIQVDYIIFFWWVKYHKLLVVYSSNWFWSTNPARCYLMCRLWPLLWLLASEIGSLLVSWMVKWPMQHSQWAHRPVDGSMGEAQSRDVWFPCFFKLQHWLYERSWKYVQACACWCMLMHPLFHLNTFNKFPRVSADSSIHWT